MTARKGILWALIGIALGLYAATTATFFSAVVRSIDLVLVVVVYLVFRQQIYQSALVAVTAGIVIDLFSSGVPEGAWLKYLGCIIVLFLVSKQFLTNQSIYSVITLMGVGQIVSWVWRACLGLIIPSLSLHLSDPGTLSRFGFVLLIDALCMSLIFTINTLLAKRFVHFRRSSG